MRRAAVQLKSVHAACGGAAQVRPCGGAACATSPVSLYVRATQSRRIGSLWCAAHGTVGPMHHAPNRAPRVPARMRMTATSCAALPTTWSLQPLCFTTRARSKIQRRLSSGSRRCERAKCKVRHQSATLRLIAHATRARARACASARCSAPFARTLVCASMKQ
ncbi:hypothetical protein HanXRQr2_Chr10g0452061 [Helianthus annuus]|uniref:Uncharacterized protein n=1 Tax=Helianthus annuus TaxID=4232 RepID=A0A9K3HZX3_HELAN|nr:hypothetical protein HanXRQr2_Chr10g0452061 [Helianthus annuus]